MTEDEVVALMKTSRSRTEWTANCDTVKAACGGYPVFWYAAIVQSGLINDVMGPGADVITVSVETPAR